MKRRPIPCDHSPGRCRWAAPGTPCRCACQGTRHGVLSVEKTGRPRARTTEDRLDRALAAVLRRALVR